MPDKGNKNQTLITGRIAYGSDGSHMYPVRVRASGTTGYLQVDTINLETIQTELLTAQTIAASTWVTGTVLSVAGVKNATFFFDYGKANTVAVSGTGTEFRIEASQKASGNDTWRALTTWYAATAAVMSAAASATAGTAGASTITILSGTAAVVSDILFWTSGTIEWSRVVAISTTASFTVQDGLTANHVAATGIFGGGAQTTIVVDVSA